MTGTCHAQQKAPVTSCIKLLCSVENVWRGQSLIHTSLSLYK